jgi:hypothetical protein
VLAGADFTYLCTLRVTARRLALNSCRAADFTPLFPLSPFPPDSSEEVTPKEISSLNDEIGEQDHQQYALVATPTKHRLTFDLKNTLIAGEPVTPDTPDSDSEQIMMKLMNVRKCQWHPASETAMMVADDADKNSELDTSSPEQPPSPIQKESKKRDGFICPKYPRKDRTEAHGS